MTERYCSHAERNARAEALRRLKAEHGITLTKYHQTTQEIADEIQQIAPSLSGDPMAIIFQWLSDNPRIAALPREIVVPKRSYSTGSDRALVAAMERLDGTPKPISMSTRAQANWPEDRV